MGRRKIEIKAIKDDRNRSVTFLKRKGGLFKKAHELSVLCSVDVAVFIFGNNKKLYEYSSADMHDLITRYTYHGAPNEHKGPTDFGNGDEDDEDEGDGTPPHGHDGLEQPRMMHPHFPGQPPSFQQLRHHTPSASPPIANGAAFQGHSNQHLQRTHTPQPPGGSRPASRNDGRRISMVPQSMAPSGAHPGITYMPTPPIYNPPPPSSGMAPQPSMGPQSGGSYSYQAPQPTYMEDRRPSAPPSFQHPPPPPQSSQNHPGTARTEASPPPGDQEHLNRKQPIPQISAPPHEPDRRPQGPQPPPSMPIKTERQERPTLLTTDAGIKKLPARKSHSIFTPIEENQSILSQHLASFVSEPQTRAEMATAAAAAAAKSHAAAEAGSANRNVSTTSPQMSQRSGPQSSVDMTRTVSVSSAAESGTPSSRTNSVALSAAGGTRPRGPRLTVQIPDGGSEPGSVTGETPSPRNPADSSSNAPHRQNAHSMVLPPPSPSASALHSAGATGPPNPFARPQPSQSVNGETPVSALPSRFLNSEYLPSPGSIYPDWNYRASDSNTLPSPLNFGTPTVGSGPSFLRDDGGGHNHAHGHNPGAVTTALPGQTTAAPSGGPLAPGPAKRKSPDYGGGDPGDGHDAPSEPKRVKVD